MPLPARNPHVSQPVGNAAEVRDEVLAATNRQQQPFVYGSLPRQEIYLLLKVHRIVLASV